MIGDLDPTAPIPDLVEPIRAVRCWVTSTHQPTVLRSVNGTEWKPGEPIEAACRPNFFVGDRDAIDAIRELLERTPCQPPSSTGSQHLAGSGCGIYSFTDAAHMLAEYPRVGRTLAVRLPAIAFPTAVHTVKWEQGMVAGEVLLSGRVMVHEHGYRAQRARIACMYRGTHPDVDELAAHYGVPVVDFDLEAAQVAGREIQLDRMTASIRAQLDRRTAALEAIRIRPGTLRRHRRSAAFHAACVLFAAAGLTAAGDDRWLQAFLVAGGLINAYHAATHYRRSRG